MFERLKWYLLMHVIIFIWGFTGILGKLIHLEALHLVWHRILVAFISLIIGLWIIKMPMRIKSRKHLLATFAIGFLVAMHWVTFYISVQLSTASLGILCLSTATLHVTWLNPIFIKSKFSWLEFSFGIIVIYGIYVVSENFSPQDYEALAYGLISALCAAAFHVLNGKLGREVASSAITLHEMGFGLLSLTIVLAFKGELNAQLFEMTWSDFLWLLFLGILCTSVAFLLNIDIIKKLGSFTVSLNINLEPIYTMILAIFILNENQILSTQFYVGSAVIFAVVLANGMIKYFQVVSKRQKS